MLKDVWEWKRDAEGVAVFVAGIAAGGIIAAAPNLAFGSIYPGSRTTLAGWVVCSLGLSLLRPTWAVAGVGLSFPAFSGVMGAAEGANLFPIAMVLSLAISGPAALVGAVGGVVLRGFVPRMSRAEQNQTTVAEGN